MNLTELTKPFPPKDIEWRVQKLISKERALVLAYVTNRAVQERLDSVCGAENWKNEYQKGPDGGVLCGLSIKIGDEWVTKWDGAENTQVEEVKGGLSAAMKRAAVQWGIGRYLYNLEAGWVTIYSDKKKGRHYINDKKAGVEGSWDEPTLPAWALPEGVKQKRALAPSNVDTTTGEILEQPKPQAVSPIEQGLQQMGAVETVPDYAAILKQHGLKATFEDFGGKGTAGWIIHNQDVLPFEFWKMVIQTKDDREANGEDLTMGGWKKAGASYKPFFTQKAIAKLIGAITQRTALVNAESGITLGNSVHVS